MNRDLITKVLLFTTGTAIGSIVTWKLVKTKYEQLNKEDLESMREYYENKYRNEKTVMDVEPECDDTESVEGEVNREEYDNIINENGYDNVKENEEEEDDDMIEPYVIAPEEYWEADYPTISLTYYEGDDTLADDDDKIIKNVDELVGEDFASHFGEYEEDSVYIRNDNVKAVYEILRDYGSYTER